MQYFKDLPIKYKLFLVYGMLSLVLFVLSFTLLFSQVRNHLERRIRAELNKSNQTITDMVETTATVSIKNHLRAIAEKNREILTHLYGRYREGRITEATAMDRAIQALLSQTVGETGYIYCINSQGLAVVHPRPQVRGSNFSFRRFIREQMRRKEGYLEYDWKNPGEENPRPKALYMTYFEPWDWIISVSSYKSEFSRLISVDDFRESILGLTFGKTGYSFITDTRGNIIVHPEMSGNHLDISDARGVQIIKEMIRRKKGYMTYLWKNPSETAAREKFVAFDHIPDFEWIIASSSYTSEVFSPLKEMQQTFLVILMLCMAVIGGVTLFVSASITRPLTRLIREFEKGSQTGDTARMDENRKDELGQFSAGYNLFMAQLTAFRQELLAEINTRKEAEKELSGLRNYLENIINSMPSVLVGIDTRGRITLLNKEGEKRMGMTRDAARGKSLSQVLPRVASRVADREGGLRHNEIAFVSKTRAGNGENRFEDITVYPLDGYGYEGAVIRIDDVTEKVRMEEVLIQSEKMLSVGGLAAGMAHEINNPLAGVIQNANLMTNRLTREDIPANVKAAEALGTDMATIRGFTEAREIPRMIRAITGAGRRMASIVDNMLSFARKGDSSFSTHDPTELMNRALELAATDFDLKKRHDFKSIHIQKEYADNLPLVPCEGTKIQQVLLNILTNGAQAMSEKRERTDYRPGFTIRLGVDAGDAMLRIEISDNGPGLDRATRKRIFEPFFTTKPVGLGTGLGLSVSYFIVTENHNGTMDVLSEKGQGATFIIRLPLSR